jgi:hypothetical protein
MKKLMLLCCSVAVLALGCAKPHRPDVIALQAKWSGTESGDPKGAPACSMVLDGGKMEFHGADPGEWYKGTYTLREDKNPKQMKTIRSRWRLTSREQPPRRRISARPTRGKLYLK